MQIFALGRNLLFLAFPYPRSRPYATRLAFLLITNLSPYPLSTAMLLSQSSATEKKTFFPVPFLPYLFLLSFPVPSSLVSSFTNVVLSGCFLGPTILLVSHACLGFGTSRCYWTIDIPRHSRTRLVLASCHSSPPLSIPSLLLLFVLNASGHRILFISSSPICFCVCSPCCLKLVSVLLYISIALLLSGHVWT